MSGARATGNGSVEHWGEDRCNGLQQRGSRPKRNLNFVAWIKRILFLFDVTMVPYMLDWWERLIIRMVALIAMWFVCYKSTQVAILFYEQLSKRWES